MSLKQPGEIVRMQIELSGKLSDGQTFPDVSMNIGDDLIDTLLLCRNREGAAVHRSKTGHSGIKIGQKAKKDRQDMGREISRKSQQLLQPEKYRLPVRGA